jgi:hypothetical protein
VFPWKVLRTAPSPLKRLHQKVMRSIFLNQRTSPHYTQQTPRQRVQLPASLANCLQQYKKAHVKTRTPDADSCRQAAMLSSHSRLCTKGLYSDQLPRLSSNQLDSTVRWPSGLRRQLKVISFVVHQYNRWSERAWVQIPLSSTCLLLFV